MKQRFGAGEAAIAVKRWFHRCPDDLDGLTFVEFVPEEPPSEQEFISSFDLRAVDVKLERVKPLPLASSVKRHATRSKAKKAGFRAPPIAVDERLKISEDEDRRIRAVCDAT